MRTLRLAKVVAQAEGLRLRRLAHRTTYRGIYGAVAAVFAIALLAVVHFALHEWMLAYVSPLAATGILALVDLVIAGIFGLLSIRSSPDAVELEATRVRDTARAQLTDTLTMTALIGPAMRLAGGRKITSIAIGALAARYFMSRSK